MAHRSALALVLVLIPAAARAQQPLAAPRLGALSFPTSVDGAPQQAFLEGVLFLHSFEYKSAELAFRRAQALQPGFVMAHWGEAMTYNHPVWNEQDLSSARGALERLAPTGGGRLALPATPRERGYLEAVELLFGSGSKARRDTLYAGAMERLVREHPDDPEAKLFYALALLGLNQGVRDTVTYLRAAPYADTVFLANPEHPGAAHYLIHAYDDPIHAPLGLHAARAFARIAPDAAHAQHMTTHIFLAMGMWDEVVSQNRIALRLQAELPGHYSSWLVYGLIQQGRYGAAQQLIERLRRNLGGGGLHGQHGALVDMRGHYLLHSEDWRGPVFEQESEHDRMSLDSELSDVFVRGAIAFRRRDHAPLADAGAEMGRLVDAMAVDRGPDDPATRVGRILALELGGMALFLAGSREEGVRAVTQASRLEDALPMEFGPPTIVEPTHELLGWMLLELDPRKALAAFQRALLRAPGRSRALMGLARAAIATGDKAAATRAIEQLTANWKQADPRVRDELIPLRRQTARLP
jgi:tetratricopeptide (TPR) repeat protein